MRPLVKQPQAEEHRMNLFRKRTGRHFTQALGLKPTAMLHKKAIWLNSKQALWLKSQVEQAQAETNRAQEA